MPTTPHVSRSPTGGYSLIELLVALALFALAALIGYPALHSASAALRLDLASQELAGALRFTRSRAVTRSANVGLKLYPLPDGRVEWRLHRDGDGDGVRTRDIENGVDPPIGPKRVLAHFGRDVRFGFPSDFVPTDPSRPSRRMDRLDDPIRFNRSDMASFGPLGTGTPGTLYLTDGRSRLVAVRVFGRTGKITILRYDPRRERWR